MASKEMIQHLLTFMETTQDADMAIMKAFLSLGPEEEMDTYLEQTQKLATDIFVLLKNAIFVEQLWWIGVARRFALIGKSVVIL